MSRLQNVTSVESLDRSARLRLCNLLLLGIAVASAYRVWLVFDANPIDQVWSDMERHWMLGTRPLEASPFAAIDGVGFQLYVGVLAKLSVQSPLLVAYWTSLLSAVMPWFWYRFAREAVVQRELALALWAVVAALPSWSAIYSYFMQETLLLPLLGAALWATWRARRKGGVGPFVVALMVWLMAGLTRGICLPLAAVALSWLWIAQDDKLRRAGASIVVLAIVVVPLAGRSWSIARTVSPHGIGQLAHLYQLSGARELALEFTRPSRGERWTYVFRSPSMSHAPFAPLSGWTTFRAGRSLHTIDLDAGRTDWTLAKLNVEPWDSRRAAWLTGENLVHLFWGPSWPDADIEGPLRRPVGRANYAMRWLWAPLTLLCAVWLWRRRHDHREWMIPTLIATWILVQGVFPLSVNEGRYRKPLEGLLLAQCLLLAGTVRPLRRTSGLRG